jgi:flagellar basal body-associated protein FliL
MARKKKGEAEAAEGEAQAPAEGSEEEAGKKKGGKKKKIIIIVGVLVVLFLAKTMFLGGGKVSQKALDAKQAKCTTTTTLKPYPVVARVGLDPITLSIGASYLKVDLAVEVVRRVPCPEDEVPEFLATFSADTFKSGDGQLARDAARRVLQNYSIDALQTAEGRNKAIDDIKAAVVKKYDGFVDDVFVGDFYWQ